MALQWWLILNRRAATLVTLLSTQGCLSASSRVRKVSNVHTPAILHIYEDLQSYIRTPAIVHTPAMMVYSTKRSWVRPPPPWGWISPALASHIFHHVPILMRPNNTNKHFNAPSLRKSHVWWDWDGFKAWSVVPAWGQLHIRALPRWSQCLRNNNIYPSTPGRGSLQDVTVEAPCLERCGDFLDVWSRRTFSHF